MKNYRTSEQGFAALASVLVITAVVLIVGMSVSLLSINNVQNSLSAKKSEESLDLVEACVEEALLRINEDASLPAALTLPEGSCSVTVNAQAGSDWDVTVSGEFEGAIKSIRVVAERTNTVTITQWLQT